MVESLSGAHWHDLSEDAPVGEFERQRHAVGLERFEWHEHADTVAFSREGGGLGVGQGAFGR